MSTFYTGLRGEQLTIPDTRLTQKEKLDKRAEKPLTPKVEQKAPPGMFDEEARSQQEMF